MEINQLKLSKILSYALRHAPKEYALVLDNEGWTNLDDVIKNINLKHPEFNFIEEKEIVNVIQNSSKKRIEIKNKRIRALYGHSLKRKIVKNISDPPKILYHGTSSEAWEQINKEGIKAMNRQYVHLAETIYDVKIVAKRKSKDIVVISIDTKKASLKRINFYKENSIWLADSIPVDCIYKL